jgi:lysozyme
MLESMKKKNILVNVCTFMCGLVVGGALVYFVNAPKATGIVETTEDQERDYSQVYGIDVSFWQGNIDWDQLSLPCDEDGCVSGKIPAPRNQRPVQFAFVRVTKSDSLVDSLYHKNYNEAKRLGIPCGAYHFLTDTVSGKAQAEFFLSHVKLEPGDLPPVLDVEIDSPDIVTKANEWLEIVEKKCGVKALIYTNMHVYASWIKNDSLLNEHDLWLAKPKGEMPDVPNCKFWQFTHEGHVWGIIDNMVDINMFNGSLQELKDYIQEKGIK